MCNAFRNIGIKIARGDCVCIGIAAVIHQRYERRTAVSFVIRQAPHPTESTIDELRSCARIEQHDTNGH